MYKFYVKGTNILARKSKRDYRYCVLVLYPDGTHYVHSCHFTAECAWNEMAHMVSDYQRHPQDFCDYYNPLRKGCLNVSELEIR